MVGRLVDWCWIWMVAVCCCVVGGIQAFDESVSKEVAGPGHQIFLLVLNPDISSREKIELRGEIGRLSDVERVEWLNSEEVLSRMVNEKLTRDDLALVESLAPQAVELWVPVEAVLHGGFDPQYPGTLPGVERSYWDDTTITHMQQEKARWNLRVHQILLGLQIASAIILAAGFLLTLNRNRLRIMTEKAGLHPEVHSGGGRLDLYAAGPLTWLQAMATQAVITVALAFGLFLTFNQMLTLVDSAPSSSLLSTTRWGFLVAAAALAFVGKGLDLLRIRLRFGKLR